MQDSPHIGADVASEPSSLYFAYGSNLDPEQMQRRCPGHKRQTVAYLSGWRLTFRGYIQSRNGAVATIDPEERSEVWGFLYCLSEDNWKSLDRFEGGYERISVEVVDHNEQVWSAQTYRKLEGEIGLSSSEYKAIIVNGANRLELPEHWIKMLEAIKTRDC
jgi:gamma-glutamylcyclotransferase (GGCT)/AIG2-like uncharacterized protein YtfP